MWVKDDPIYDRYRSTYLMFIHKIHVLELQIETNVYDSCSFLALLKQ